jgi:aminopeptidase N
MEDCFLSTGDKTQIGNTLIISKSKLISINKIKFSNSFILATQFEVICGARCVFPSFDDPSFKANFTVSLIYPTAFQALGNMPNSSPPVAYG